MKLIVSFITIFLAFVVQAQYDSVGLRSEPVLKAPQRSSGSADQPAQTQQNSIKRQINSADTVPLIAADSVKKSFPVFYDSLFSVDPVTENQEHFIDLHAPVSDYVLPVVLLLLLIYFTWLRYQYAKQISENITSILNMNLAQQFYRYREFSFNIFNILLYGNAIFVFGIYIYQLCNYYKVQLPFANPVFNIVLCLGIFPLAYFLKSVAYYIFRILFRLDTAVRFFRFNSLIVYQLLAIVLLPCVVLMVTTQEPLLHWVILVSFTLTGLAFILRLYKGFIISLTNARFHVLYFLLYICALEIAPLLIVYKSFTLFAG